MFDGFLEINAKRYFHTLQYVLTRNDDDYIIFSKSLPTYDCLKNVSFSKEYKNVHISYETLDGSYLNLPLDFDLIFAIYLQMNELDLFANLNENEISFETLEYKEKYDEDKELFTFKKEVNPGVFKCVHLSKKDNIYSVLIEFEFSLKIQEGYREIPSIDVTLFVAIVKKIKELGWFD